MVPNGLQWHRGSLFRQLTPPYEYMSAPGFRQLTPPYEYMSDAIFV